MLFEILPFKILLCTLLCITEQKPVSSLKNIGVYIVFV